MFCNLRLNWKENNSKEISPTGSFLLTVTQDLTIVKLLALALTNLVPDLANLVTNLAKQSLGQPRHQTDQT